MFLDVANRLRIDDPTPEQIEHHLRNLPADAPFLILDADDEQFIQATQAGDLVRVEWRQEERQRFMFVSIDRAAEAFLAFRRWDEPALAAFPWRRLGLLNDPYRRAVLAGVLAVSVLLAAAALRLWSAVR